MVEISFREGVREVLRTELRRNPHMVVLGENVATWGGAAGVTLGLVEEFGAERVIETPVSENAIVGQALGAALGGLSVALEVYSADFLFCAGSEVINDIAKWRFQHRWEDPIHLVLRMPMASSGIAAGPEHTQCIEAYLLHTPGLVVVAPGTVRDAIGTLRAAIGCGDPVIFLEHRRLYDARQEVGPADVQGHVVDLGTGCVVRTGNDVTVVAWAWMRTVAEEAAATLEGRGISVELVDPITIKPMDTALIRESVQKTRRLLVVEESPISGSVAAEIIANVVEEGLPIVNAARVTMPDVPNPFDPDLEAALIPSGHKVCSAVERMMAR